jgi:hypothetical protein
MCEVISAGEKSLKQFPLRHLIPILTAQECQVLATKDKIKIFDPNLKELTQSEITAVRKASNVFATPIEEGDNVNQTLSRGISPHPEKWDPSKLDTGATHTPPSPAVTPAMETDSSVPRGNSPCQEK